MTSKQEKLAAARRKLKEFQGKNKEAELCKQKNVGNALTSKGLKNCSKDTTLHGSFLFGDGENSKITSSRSQPYNLKECIFEKTEKDNLTERKTPEPFNTSSPSKLWPEHYHLNNSSANNILDKSQDGEKSDFFNGLKTDHTESQNLDEGNSFNFLNFSNSISKDNSLMLSESNSNSDGFSFNNAIKAKPAEVKEFFNDMNNKSLNNVIKPLQTDLQNQAQTQTIQILVQQRNEAQDALSEVERLLNNKSGEANELKQQITQLTSSIKNLRQRLSDAEDVIMKLKLEKEDNLTKQEELKSLLQNLREQLDEKQEVFLELTRKYAEKNKECQRLLFSLQEAQSQLSLCQIQLQEYSAEGHSSLASQVSDLQNENLKLKQKILELEKKCEAVNREKEESSQKFQTYAQQCNTQLAYLNRELKSLELENETLSQENKILAKNLSELENAKEDLFSSQSFENEIANLHNQLSAFSEENNYLKSILKKKKQEHRDLQDRLNKKESEFDRVLQELEELEEENKKLQNEAETPKANERLLATMESDKVAAAKAVSQNKKLKEQIFELEKAFMKLSEEKLDLTNQLSHEKHVNIELQNLLKNSKSNHKDDHHHHHQCHHEDEKTKSLINDSNEIKELRNIIRQLQDDKIELTARLNLYESTKDHHHEGRVETQRRKSEEKHDLENVQCENTKLLLQQMEEKVRKTMNEIAVLDEEKEKLEHLVVQLQGETETIGEYITLYQKQRMILRQRAQEKDIQLLQLSKDKEELKSKLIALDELVQRLIAERKNISVQPGAKLSAANSSIEAAENTARKIRSLINEIGSTTLINNHSIAFEHCSCCSGRLITI